MPALFSLNSLFVLRSKHRTMQQLFVLTLRTSNIRSGCRNMKCKSANAYSPLQFIMSSSVFKRNTITPVPAEIARTSSDSSCRRLSCLFLSYLLTRAALQLLRRTSRLAQPGSSQPLEPSAETSPERFAQFIPLLPPVCSFRLRNNVFPAQTSSLQPATLPEEDGRHAAGLTYPSRQSPIKERNRYQPCASLHKCSKNFEFF